MTIDEIIEHIGVEPYHREKAGIVLIADVIDALRSLPDESVHCCVSSPPYWGLRDYGTEGQLGLEKTPEEYIAKMTKVFREVRRVLRGDGTCWMNLGDSYAGSWGNSGHRPEIDGTPSYQRDKVTDYLPRGGWDQRRAVPPNQNVPGLKPKDLVGIPWRVALALQADGWWLRSDIIWSKPNPMPESVTDRPTKAHEYIFLLTKSARYFYDAEAVKEANSVGAIDRFGKNPFISVQNRKYEGMDGESLAAMGSRTPVWLSTGRNLRSVWDIATQPYPQAHFATFPEKIPEMCIKAGTSLYGVCPVCGAQWERVLEKVDTGKRQKMADGWDTGNGGHGTIHRDGREKGEPGLPVLESKTIGWQPTCSCGRDDRASAVVLDPFGGSGTTAYVARKMRRHFIHIDIGYPDLVIDRLRQGELF